MKRLLSLILLLAAPAMVIAAYYSIPTQPDNSSLLTPYAKANVVRYVQASGNPSDTVKHVSAETLKAVMGQDAHVYATDPVTSNAQYKDWTTSATAAR